MYYDAERLGEVLLRIGHITQEQLDAALSAQATNGGRLGDVLLQGDILTEEQVSKALAIQKHLEHLEIASIDVDRSAALLLPTGLAKRRNALPVGFVDGELVLAMSDPLDIEVIDETELLTGYKVRPVVAASSQIRNAIDKYLVGTDDLLDLEAKYAAAAVEANLTAGTDLADSSVPLVRVVNQQLRDAIVQGASDVHFEAEEHGTRVRFRIDGALSDVTVLPRSSHAGLVSRIKVMAEMNIAERRSPQDGRIAFWTETGVVDMRVATLPTVHGESVVVRLLNLEIAYRSLDELQLPAEERVKLERMLAKPYGTVLMAGPTGAGKTTTLYALLHQVTNNTRKVVTIEDPVEYQMAGVSQIALNPRAGLTFASGLRSILRFDPDIVMVGEVRDSETAAIAVRAALTGHFVLTSIHTNDAPSALTRLTEMGVEPYITASGLVGVVSQRLVRVLCPKCKKPISIAPEILVAAGFSEDEAHHVVTYGPQGCESCHRTGYSGRLAVFEIMEMDDDIRRAFVANASSDDLRAIAIQNGMSTLRRHALTRVSAGLTSLEEINRIVV